MGFYITLGLLGLLGLGLAAAVEYWARNRDQFPPRFKPGNDVRLSTPKRRREDQRK